MDVDLLSNVHTLIPLSNYYLCLFVYSFIRRIQRFSLIEETHEKFFNVQLEYPALHIYCIYFAPFSV